MPAMEVLRLKFRNKIYIPLTCKKRNKKLINKKFTIISNNCWAGTVYEAYDIKKQSPTVGMFFMATDYIKFVSDLKGYLKVELKFINSDKSKWKQLMCSDKRFGHYPIGLLKDIEIHFLHYHSEQEAKEKWQRRIGRINWDHLLIKFNDQNGCTEEHIREFESLDFKNKICFTVNEYSEYPSAVQIWSPKGHQFIRASYEPIGKKIIEIINQM